MTPEDRVAAVASRYDGPDDEAGQLEAAALRRLAWRSRRGGKPCPRCERTLPLGEFRLDGSATDGLRFECRECEARSARERYVSTRVSRDSGPLLL